MSSLLIYIFILCIWNSILFFDNSLGVNVILFIIPLVVFLCYALKINNKIKNKYGLLFIIPICLLSISYLIYDNMFFKMLNVILIPVMFLFMYIYTIRPTFEIMTIFKDCVRLLFEPFDCIKNICQLIKMKLNDTFKLSNDSKKKVKSVLIVIPIVIVVLLLLTSADMIFSNIFKNMFRVFNGISIENIFARLFIIFVLFLYLSGTVNYVLFGYKEEKTKNKKPIESYTIKLLLTILNVIYVVFDFIQIRSLIFHKISMNISYASYARQGFFQLMFISIINLIIILLSKRSKESKYTSVSNLIMVILTFVIIASSFIRMNMYESAYGYTLLRLLVYVTLITEVILLIPTVFYIFNSKIKIIKHYMIIIVFVYVVLSLSPVDYIIARRNINRYYKTKKIDIYYLENYNFDNVPLLVDLCNNTSDLELKQNIKFYLKELSNEYDRKNIFEYNISRENALDIIKK